MKSNYTICLDSEKVDRIKAWLETKGLSFSGYLNALLDEQITAIDLFAPEGDVKKVTAGKLLKMAGKMVKNLNAERKK
jgi:hypothetical protein